ncbi:MAG TPA: HAD-IC family P-type ATPase, partial [bacterium]
SGLKVDQSLLTGESLPVTKAADDGLPEGTPLADRANLVYSGTAVVQGRGVGLVVGTGASTQVGLIATQLVEQAGVKPPLILRMEQFTRTIALVVLALCGTAFCLGILRGIPWDQMLYFALAMAVSSIPEGLPVALTVALAIAVKRMAGRHVLVRRLAAVEALGSCSVIGSDKTGTLTMNHLTVVELRTCGDVAPPQSAPSRTPVKDSPEWKLLRAMLLCNEAARAQDGSGWRGDSADVALAEFADGAGVRQEALLLAHPRVGAIPFEPELRFAATFHGGPPGLSVVKGAPERVLAMCTAVWDAHRGAAVPVHTAQVRGWIHAMASQGQRVLAIAEGPWPGPTVPPAPEGLTLLGLVGMSDPPRPDAAEAVAACRGAGIRVLMITGDHAQTAQAIAAQLGIAHGAAVTREGPEPDAMSDAELAAAAPGLSVVARATPTTKLRIVQALQARGEFVAVTGDGVNDAPALRAAHIGVAMGKGGSDVARDASDLVITDDRFASIVAGVEEGRVAYDNVRKVIFLLVSSGLGEVAVVLLALLCGAPVPFLPAQLLWMQLVTNGVQDVALAFEPRERNVLRREPRRPAEPVFNRMMVERTVLSCVVFGAFGFGAFLWAQQHGNLEDARSFMLNLFVVFEVFHLVNARSETRSFLAMSPFSNRLLLVGTVVALAIHVAALHWPVTQRMLHARPPTLAEFGAIVAIAASILVTMEAHKAWRWRWPVGGARGSR